MFFYFYIITIFEFFTAKPSSPTNLMALSQTTTSIYLRWSAPMDKTQVDNFSYTVNYRFTKGTSFKKSTSATTSVNLTNLMAGKTYMIYITAKNMLFEGDPSSSINVTTRVAGELIFSVSCKIEDVRDIKKISFIHQLLDQTK